MDMSVWFYFAIACFGLALTPGPNAMLVMTHSVRFGPRATFYTITGGVLSFVALMVISLFGLDSLLKAFPSTLSYIKIGGGIYLIGLGLKQWTLRGIDITPPVKNIRASNKLALFTQGAISAISNPKVFLFFAAFLTPFINPQQVLLNQFVMMVLTFAFAEFFIEMVINLTAARFRFFLVNHGQYFCFFCGTLFIIMGIAVLFAGL